MKDSSEIFREAEASHVERLETVNAKLLAALERTVADLGDVIRIVRVDKGMRGEWPRAETGLIQARAAIEEARK